MDGFLKISKYAGMREDLVQAGGGNSSCKISEERMLIKASGYQMADLSETEGYSVVNPSMLRDVFLNGDHYERITEKESVEVLRRATIKGKRPSIETFLHAVTGKYTLHTHPIVVNVLTCRKDGAKILKKLFPDALIVPYATPGAELAKAYFREYKNKGAREFCDIIFLQNHGLVVSADTAEAVIDRTEEITAQIESYLNCDFSAYHNATCIWRVMPQKIIWRVTDANVLRAYEQFNGLWNHAFCPDCIVFLGKRAMQLDACFSAKIIREFERTYGEPVLIRYKDSLYLACDNVRKAMEAQSVLSFSAQVMRFNQDQECVFLSPAEKDRLLNWDAEKYRKKL